MMNSFKGLLLVILCIFCASNSFAQVRGISYTLAPTGEYVFWNDKAGLDDGLLIGGKLGFGFGEFFELRGTYMQGSALKSNFDNFGIENFDAEQFNSEEVNLIRYGGEIKANFSRGKLLPYITAGTGVQELHRTDADPTKQIYLSAGAGITLGIGDRFVLNLEGRNTAYRYNTGKYLLSPTNKTNLGLADFDFQMEDLSNWSGAASLQIYLGGRKPGELSELDKAYFDTFNGGSGGLNLGIEAIAGKINFHENLPYRDAWMAGGSAGFDLGPYVGVRGFYWKALEDGELTKFDDLAMYGGEVRMQLNSGGGMVPFLMIGGGKMDVGSNYESKIINPTDTTALFLSDADDTGFAMGGVGLLIPLGRNFKIFGSGRAILTSSAPIDNLDAPEEIHNSWFWSAGFKLNFGKKKRDANAIYNQNISSAVDARQKENDAKAEALTLEYENKILELENKVLEAYAENDLEKAAVLKQEKAEAEMIVDEIENRNEEAPKTANTTNPNYTPQSQGMQIGGQNIAIRPSNSVIQMSPAEFENLIEEILESTDPRLYSMSFPEENYASTMPSQTNQALLMRIKELEDKLNNESSESETIAAPKLTEEDTAADLSKKEEKSLIKMMYKLEEKLDTNNEEIKKMNERIVDLEKGKTSKKMRKNEVEQETVEPIKLFKRKKKKKNKE